MPNFLSKLFRRKGGDDKVDTGSNASSAKQTKRREKKRTSVKKERSRQGLSSSHQLGDLAPKDEEEALPSVAGTTASGRTSSVGHEQIMAPSPPKKAVSPRVANVPVRQGPIDLDDTDFDESDHDENRGDRSNMSDPPGGLSFHQLQQFNLQQQQQQQHKQQQQQQQQQQRTPPKLYVMTDHSPVSTPHSRVSNGQIKAMEDMANRSESSTSDFNLSTDAEDEEYNSLKRRMTSAMPHDSTALNSSTLDRSVISSPTSYTTDEDNAIFPALNTDDEGHSEVHPSSLISGSNDGQEQLQVQTMAHETEDDMRAWGLSPSMSSKDNGPSPSNSPLFPGEVGRGSAKEKNAFADPSHASSRDFVDFANFDNAFPDPSTSAAVPKTRPTSKSRSFFIEGTDRDLTQRKNGARSSSSATDPETNLSDLLVQARQAGGSGRGQKGSSVNSAPAMTAQYLRQQHGIRSQSTGSNDSRSPGDKTTSVSDIIQSLEATNASRLRNSSRGRSHRSVGSRESATTATVRSAKERVRERRRKEREGGGSISRRNRSRSSEVGSDHSSDNDVSENWLFDEVTGALGPRGVAADMESLSGRSKNSGGNKSHKSHRSHKSQKSATRRRSKKGSSNESVDSKNSKNSKNSRYSHRSTKSYLSQMSEQSRSVANDLLRLEMQLAMVGSQENADEAAVGRSTASTGGSVGNSSKTSRANRGSSSTSSSRRTTPIARRSKVTVVAPPGKLGIILANKADSKGTVVSGVRTSSVLAEKISPGDRIVAIDGEDVSRMTVSEITTIMARKSEFERMLTILTTPKTTSRSDYALEPEGTSYSSYHRR